MNTVHKPCIKLSEFPPFLFLQLHFKSFHDQSKQYYGFWHNLMYRSITLTRDFTIPHYRYFTTPRRLWKIAILSSSRPIHPPSSLSKSNHRLSKRLLPKNQDGINTRRAGTTFRRNSDAGLTPNGPEGRLICSYFRWDGETYAVEVGGNQVPGLTLVSL